MAALFSSFAATRARRAAGLGLLVVLGGLWLTLAASIVTGPAFDEERRMAAARHATDLVRAIGDFGPGSILSSSARGIYDELLPFGVTPGLISGWLGEVLAKAGLFDRVVGERFGWLLWTGLAPAALYWILQPSRGPRVAAVAACLLMAMPRWVHAAAGARDAAVVTTVWLLITAAYVRSLAPPLAARKSTRAPHFHWTGIAFAVVVGLGVATSLASLWVMPLLVVHYAGTRPSVWWRAARRGYAEVPSAWLWAIVIAPAVLVLVAPEIWTGGATGAADWLFAPLTPKIEPILYRGAAVVSARDVPAGYAARWIFATVPVGVLAFALGGAAVLVKDFAAVRRGTRPREETRLGLLALLSLGAVILGPALAPTVLTQFPPRVEALLPVLAACAAVAVDRLAIRVVGERRAFWVVVPAALAFVGSGLVGVRTASTSFNALVGGTRHVVEGRMWSVGDGSEIAGLLPRIDALGSTHVSIDAPEVSHGYWSALTTFGRLRTHVDVERGGHGTFTVVRGTRSGAIATVERDGATLWTLARR